MASGTPPAEIEIDAALVSALLRDHGIDTATRPLTELAHGWDNVMFRVAAGHHAQPALRQRLVVRLPRREVAVALLRHEQHWLPRLFLDSPLPIPRPLLMGEPAHGYPWPFSVLPYLAGRPSDLAPPSADQAAIYADFLAAVHQPAPKDAPHNPYRGVPLVTREKGFMDRWARCRGELADIEDQVLALWHEAVNAPIDLPPTWLHGDPHARNLLVKDGKISGVIDWGDLCAGDRANDLSAIWMHFHSAEARLAARTRYQQRCPAVTPNTWLRAKGWALMFALMLYDTGRIDTPRHMQMGKRTLSNLLADEQAPTSA